MATIVGSLANDVLIGTAGNDTIIGDNGNDLMIGGAGNDVFQWDPGDGNDTLEGQAGTDTLRFNGSNASEIVDISANGGRVRFSRNVAAITMDLDDVERIEFKALGGADTIVVNELTGTDAKLVAIDLSGAAGGGDGLADSVTVNGTNGGDIVNVALAGKAISVTGLSAQVTIAGAEAANDALTINALGGNDAINASKLAAGIVQLVANGGAGNDTITGSGGADFLIGLTENDVILGGAGADLIFGGDGNDTLTGGKDNDQIFGEIGDDRMIWNPGDGTDVVEGGDGIDTAQVNGSNATETFTITANGARVLFNGVSPTAFALDIGTTESLVLKANGGNDQISAGVGLAALIQLTIDGGAGNDTILGGNGADTLLGGDGNDFIDGNVGADVAFLGAGNDVFQWDPGDGSDTVEGQAGTDTLLFNGSAGDEIFGVSANGERVSFTRNVGNITMDLNDLESIKLNALGGIDTITVNDLAGTDAKLLSIDLAGVLGGTAGDSQADTVLFNCSDSNDKINAAIVGGAVSVTGLQAQMTIAHAEAMDLLAINGLGGNDSINMSKLTAGIPQLILIGAAGNDTITGSAGADQLFGVDDNDSLLGGDGTDTLAGGAGNDVLTGGKRDDQVFGDLGDDRMIWNPGDGSDFVEGGDGSDTAEVNGSNSAEVFTVAANVARVLFNGVSPTAFALDIGTTETLVVKANGGNDQITATGNLAALILLTLDGGLGNDTILGGNGKDFLLGGDGNDFIDGQVGDDIALLGGGNDVFQWDPGDGDDVVEGQAGTDTLLFNGNGGIENFDISANGARVRLLRDIGNVTMDLNDVERIELQTLGGADNIVVNSLTGTDAKLVAIDLAATLGGIAGDLAVDTVAVNGTGGNNSISLGFAADTVFVNGLSAQVTIAHAEAIDSLTINALAGNDIVNASKLPATTLQLVIDGGDGNDTITGGAGNDTVIGGAGNDIVAVGLGNDTVRYTSALDGHDVISSFDGDAAGGQDTLDLDLLFDSLGVLAADRAARVSIVDKGAKVDVAVDVDGNIANGFEVIVATLNTADAIAVGQDVILGG